MSSNTITDMVDNLPRNADFGTISFGDAEYQFYRERGEFFLRRELRQGSAHADIRVERTYRSSIRQYDWVVSGAGTYTPRELSLKLDSRLKKFRE